MMMKLLLLIIWFGKKISLPAILHARQLDAVGL